MLSILTAELSVLGDVTRRIDSHFLNRLDPMLPSRNDRCPCGSGRKFKVCHLRDYEPALRLKPPTSAPGESTIERAVASNNNLTRQEGRIRFLSAERATVLIGFPERLHQICQVQFAKDGGIFVHFPYFPPSLGILSETKAPPVGMKSVTYELTELGKFTSELVKFSHHPDGEVHFSQDGKVRTAIRRTSFPLDGPIGQIFQLNAYWPSGFAELTRVDKKRGYLTFLFRDRLPTAIRVVAEWRRKKEISDNVEGVPPGPRTEILKKSTGESFQAFFFGPPTGFPIQDHVLVVSAGVTVHPKNVDSTTMVFVGGLDLHEVAAPGIPAAPSGSLVFLYPSKAKASVIKQIGSIDLRPRDLQ